MTDQELLEAAAKAAGYNVEPYTWSAGTEFEYHGFRYNSEVECQIECEWNPLEDDGDALRLAVKLGFVVDTSEMPARVCRPYEATLAHEPNGADPAAATRRAIVRAAAEIGQGILQKVGIDLPEDNYYKTEAEAVEAGRAAAELGKTR